MAMIATWMLIASMAAYFHAMNLAYAQHEAAAAAARAEAWARTPFLDKIKMGLGF